jgi:hypothetical protein
MDRGRRTISRRFLPVRLVDDAKFRPERSGRSRSPSSTDSLRRSGRRVGRWCRLTSRKGSRVWIRRWGRGGKTERLLLDDLHRTCQHATTIFAFAKPIIVLVKAQHALPSPRSRLDRSSRRLSERRREVAVNGRCRQADVAFVFFVFDCFLLPMVESGGSDRGRGEVVVVWVRFGEGLEACVVGVVPA